MSGGPSLRYLSLPTLAPHHKIYLSVLLGTVGFFTVLSLIFGTHTYNAAAAYAPGPEFDQIRSQASKSTSYFASKSNWINVFFIKIAWGWTTVAWLAQALTLRAQGKDERVARATSSPLTNRGKARASPDSAIPGVMTDDGVVISSPQPDDQEGTIASPLSKSLLRFIVATTCWLFFANWLFGPPLMERIFTSSGGVCIPRIAGAGMSNPSGSATPAAPLPLLGVSETRIDAAFCRAGGKGIAKTERPELFLTAHRALTDGLVGEAGRLRGQWRGGHDTSGHTFILILSSLLLLEELTPYLPHYLSVVLPSSLSTQLTTTFFPASRGTFSQRRRNPYLGDGPSSKKNFIVTSAVLALVGLWIFSLMNTALFFHTPQEKLSGAMLALGAWALLPKGG